MARRLRAMATPATRGHRVRGGDDRRLLRRIAAATCLLLAFACLVAAVATLSAQAVPGDPGAQKLADPPWARLPLLNALVFLIFLVVLASALRRRRRAAAVRGTLRHTTIRARRRPKTNLDMPRAGRS
ncbi:MAG: hypothetical protein HY359_05315 [Candidatus Rokubacteria bacterium]|nr:hypothetical protein [Candidatus Rokubacteria bacterium]